MSEILSMIGLAIKLALLIFDKSKEKKGEERRALLTELDDEIKKAKVSRDLTGVSKWLGSKL